MDSIGDGDIDTLAVDLTGDGEFDLYFHDSDGNGLPDLVFLNDEGDGTVEVLGFGPEVEKRVILAAHAIMTMIDLEEYAAEALDSALDNLQKEIDDARKLLKSK